MLDILERLLESLMTPLTAEQLAAPEVATSLLAVLILIADHWKQLELCLALGGAQQSVIHRIHALRYDSC